VDGGFSCARTHKIQAGALECGRYRVHIVQGVHSGRAWEVAALPLVAKSVEKVARALPLRRCFAKSIHYNKAARDEMAECRTRSFSSWPTKDGWHHDLDVRLSRIAGC